RTRAAAVDTDVAARPAPHRNGRQDRRLRRQRRRRWKVRGARGINRGASEKRGRRQEYPPHGAPPAQLTRYTPGETYHAVHVPAVAFRQRSEKIDFNQRTANGE